MKVKRIKIQDFRNIKQTVLDMSEGVNLLYGNNAQGKTNLIESIYYFSRGKSFRGASDDELRRIGECEFFIGLEYESEGRFRTLSYRVNPNFKKKLKDGIDQKKLTEMIGHFRAVLFYPEHLSLIKEGPSLRRDFIDVGISQIKPTYMSHYNEYNKILKQRNSIIKDAQKGFFYDKNMLDSFSDALAVRAALINEQRRDYLREIEFYARRVMLEISDGKEEISLHYVSDARGSREDMQDRYTILFRQNVKKELAAGCTLYGIHRDDIDIEINGISARHFASQGQQRSIVLALKMAEGEVCRERTGEYPVYLFDDVLSELDEKRRRYVLAEKSDRQIIISACEKKDFDGVSANIINVEDGEYVSSHG